MLLPECFMVTKVHKYLPFGVTKYYKNASWNMGTILNAKGIFVQLGQTRNNLTKEGKTLCCR